MLLVRAISTRPSADAICRPLALGQAKRSRDLN
jgi:hypothetical protein